MTNQIAIDSTGGVLRLLVNGAVQSVEIIDGSEPPGYWLAMLPLARPERVLILGLGGGSLVHLLRRRFGPLSITGVDDSPQILAIGRTKFGLEPSIVDMHEEDALEYLRRSRQRFDFVFVDLFCGEELPSIVASASFQNCLRAAIRPGGRLVWNLHRDRRSASVRRRLKDTMLPERVVLAGLNLVLHMRRRHYQKS